MSPDAKKLLARMAVGYRVEFEHPGDFDSAEVYLRKYDESFKDSCRLVDALRELQGLRLVDTAANGSGSAWVNELGKAKALWIWGDE